jgi:hypothetical protein
LIGESKLIDKSGGSGFQPRFAGGAIFSSLRLVFGKNLATVKPVNW